MSATNPPRPRATSTWATALLVAASVAVSLVVAEVAARIYVAAT